MGYLLDGFKMNDRGRIIHRTFDSDELFHGHAKADGWVDSPDKVPGAKKAIQAEVEAKAATANTFSAEPPLTKAVHGEKRRPGRPRKSP